MSKVYIWIGQFQSNAEFETYINQSKFRQWWAEHDEDNLELSCQFCKELNISSYDEDFLVTKFSPCGIDELVKMIPAKTEKVMQLCKEQNIQKANAAICYNIGEDITRTQAKKAKSMFFLGTFDFQADEIEGVSTSLAGLRNLTWVGITHKSKDEFMQYFNQDEYLEELRKFNNGETKKRPNPMLRCQFCKDLGINFYYPEFLYIEFADNIIEAKELVRRVIKDEFLYDVVDFTLEKQKIRMANCAFCYIPNGFRDKKKDQKIFIFKKELFSSGNKPKNYIEELDNYNGLTFLGGFMWD